MADRSWRWLKVRIESLLDRPVTFIQYDTNEGKKLAAVPSTRLGYQVHPPVFE